MTVIASTASPYKFARSVLHAIDDKYDAYDDMEQFDILSSVSKTKLPDAILELKNAEIRHRDVIEASDMKETILKKLGVL